jgi:error-prone DNA polymerase
MGTLPRVAPRTFYDIAIEVALIRPGPIQGHAVNPYIRRRRGEEPVTYLHPLLEPILKRTLGVPLFQEQLMEMAVAIAGFSAADADELRQAMAAKRSAARMEKMRARLYEGMAARDVTGDVADQIFEALAAFANFGFPESHSVSFAHLVYSSAWLKLHYPAAFTAGLLNSQPMGFWSSQSLVADARRHDVSVRRPHVNRSEVGASLEGWPSKPVLRLGLGSVRGVGESTAERIVAGRPWAGGEDLVRRAGVSQAQLETLAAAGALDPEDTVLEDEAPVRSMTSVRRRLLWAEGLEAIGVLTAAALEALEDGDRATVAGAVTHRQHPETARGAVFVNLEDETGHVNVVFSRGAWARWKHVARHSPVLLIRGRVRKGQGAVSFDAERVEALSVGTPVPASRDFR